MAALYKRSDEPAREFHLIFFAASLSPILAFKITPSSDGVILIPPTDPDNPVGSFLPYYFCAWKTMREISAMTCSSLAISEVVLVMTQRR